MHTSLFPPDDSPEAISDWLSDVTADMWQALDLGKSEAEAFFANVDGCHDPHFWAHIVRFTASRRLQKSHSGTFTVTSLPNSGIQIEKGPYAIRVCKADNGMPQSPGRNRARRTFFQQLSLGTLVEGSVPQNLILYWRVRGGEIELGLCKPKGVWEFKGQPQLEWRLPLTYDPLEGIRFQPGQDDDLDIPLRFDEADLDREEVAGA